MAKVDLIDLAGDAYARGKALGVARRERIQSCVSDWLTSLRTAGVTDPEAYLAGMLESTGFAESVRYFAPDLLTEVQGIACGAEQSPDLLFAAQLMDEEWAYRASRSATPDRLQKCSSVAVRASDNSILIGQNMDLGGYTDGHQIVFRIAPHGKEPGALIFSISSMIALCGVNTHRIGVCVNSIPQLPASRHGLPVSFVIRRLLQARTLGDAVELIRTVPHATSQHYLIADTESIRSYEASPEGVVEYISPYPGKVFHTNHPLAQSLEDEFSGNVNSTVRLHSLRNRLAAGHPDLKSVKGALSSCDDPDHPVSRSGTVTASPKNSTGLTSFTTGSMISVLCQNSKAVDTWVSVGPPSTNDYERVVLPCF